MQSLIILGNCVAHRLNALLPKHPNFAERFALTPAPMIHTVQTPDELAALARTASAHDVVVTQPLFNFGSCNTEALRAAGKPGQRIVTISAPHFAAYFPDVFVLQGKKELVFPPILDWDSRILFSCFLAGVSVFDVPGIYLQHAMFHAHAMRRAVALALETCGERDQGVDVPLGDVIARSYADARLFYTWMHPSEELMAVLMERLLEKLELRPHDFTRELAELSFGFNRWPVITRHHRLFRFEGQESFAIAGRVYELEDIAMAYYNFYEFHPHIVHLNRDHALRDPLSASTT